MNDCPFRYQGQYEDSETGLYYNRFRYYSPDEGMYISQDPIRRAGISRLYECCLTLQKTLVIMMINAENMFLHIQKRENEVLKDFLSKNRIETK